MKEDLKCEFYCQRQRIMFPKNNKYEDGDFAIVSARVVEAIQGEPKLHEIYQTITLKGKLAYMEEGGTYRVVAKEVYDEKFRSYNYNVEFMNEIIKVDTKEEQYDFLSTFLTDNQVHSIFETYDNPMEIIMNKDIDGLCKVKGIGQATANKIIERFNKSKDYARAYMELMPYGLSQKLINKLCEHYGGGAILLKKIKENPYILADEVHGIGFKKADEIALKMGANPHGTNRGISFVNYFLEQEAQKGNSYVYTHSLMNNIVENLGEDYPDESISIVLQDMIKKRVLWHNTDKTMVALTKYYQLERNIAQEIFRLRDSANTFNFVGWEDKIKHLEELQGWQYTDEQWDSIKATLEHNVVLITGSAGCVDMDTEYFNGNEWKKICDYKVGEKVLQYNPNGSASLVHPQRYIKEPQETLYHIQSKYGIDQCLSIDHDVAYITSKGNLIQRPLSHVKNLHESNKNGFGGKFVTTFNYSGSGIDLDETSIRLMVAIFADGHFPEKNSTNWCRVNLKKQRKKERLEKLLKEANIPYNKVASSVDGFCVYTFYAPFRAKEYPKEWYNCSNEQFEIIADEVVHWDGSIKRGNKLFYTCSKSCADFIQFVFTRTGYRATLQTFDRRGEQYKTSGKEYIRQSMEYVVTTTKRVLVGIGGFSENEIENRPKFTEYKTKDGYQYCFTVPSEFLVLRRNDRIFITGNCGKSTSVLGMLKALDLDETEFAQTALSGKASVNLTDVTGYDGYTIHRLLGYNPQGGFAHDRDTQLEHKVIILDELSMVDAKLFYSLIQAIPNGSKLIMLGDDGQLESIGVGNIIYDLMESGAIKHCNLTKVHRQASKSAIITESHKVRHSTQIVDKYFEGELTLGELQDLHLIGYHESDFKEVGTPKPTIDLMVEKYKEKLKLTDNINDICAILPTKTSGSSCYKMNQIIQQIVIPTKMMKGITVGERSKNPYTIYRGDKVINLVNDRKASYITPNGEEVVRPIFNGNMGIVQQVNIEMGTIVIDFDNIGLVTIPRHKLTNIDLAYCVTVHKLQGSASKYVVCGLDNSHYIMQTRELVYTMLTRAKKHCDFIFETKALVRAIKNTNIQHKQTFLPYFLNGTLK